MEALLKLSDLVDRFNAALGRLTGWLTLAMVLVGAGNAVLRYVSRSVGANLSSNASLELQWYLFSALFLLAAADTLRKDAHVRVDVLYGRLSARSRAAIDIAGTLLFLLPFCAFAVWVTWPSVMESWRVMEQSPDPGGLPRYPIKSLLLVCFYLLIAQGFSQLIKKVAILTGHARPHEPGGEA